MKGGYMDNQKNPVRGITYTELLQVMLIGLKLTRLIKWSWVWVFAPTWGSLLFVLIYIIAFTLYCAIKRHLHK